MSLIRPQGENRKVKKIAVEIVPLDGSINIDEFFDPDWMKLDGETPHYFMLDPEDDEICYCSAIPFTLAQARKVYKKEYGEEKPGGDKD